MWGSELLIHPMKSIIAYLHRQCEKKYPNGFDYLQFAIRPNRVKFKNMVFVVPSKLIRINFRRGLL